MAYRTIRINEFTISLKNGEEWIARKGRKIVARNYDWVPLMRSLGIRSKEDIKENSKPCPGGHPGTL